MYVIFFVNIFQRLLNASRERDQLPFVPTREGVWASQAQLGPAALLAIHPCAAVAISGGWDVQKGFPADLPFSV